MKITRTSDWREALPWETPIIAETVMPGEPARCVTCGVTSDAVPRTELWAVKHRHPHDPAGSVRLYCVRHTPAAPAAPVVAATTSAPVRSRGKRVPGSPASPREQRTPRAPQPAERVAAVCPDCFMEVPPSGICGMCGQKVA
ncbi:glucose-6-phosphate dehydrogenase [Microbacterium horticulturae]|uniref:Glucose-6-phosphate dehydrogenase n=1 Tax=Microbacterium horticulturae TaxID=3028316 RepID=A0ABY8C3J8_9MICO|nr:glucose-6-phosphate dehydrogenase [Microbacterium sp. KACC 23027]WEG09646.1 glucose-6-phosphate dehydrogenase [Microbacterium sp. KACC 23027]